MGRGPVVSEVAKYELTLIILIELNVAWLNKINIFLIPLFHF